MRILGRQFVMGRTIGEALDRAAAAEREGYRHSYDMLGEAAKTAADAQRYHDAYSQAIAAIGRSADGKPVEAAPGISVKLSALHPRYEMAQRERVMRELLPRLADLAAQARQASIGLTVDAEEADRLELSLDLFEALAGMPTLAGWEGLGLAVQAYQKRAPAVIGWLAELAANDQAPADGAAGQGRLLGQRSEARAGARARYLSGLHPQGRHRRLLPRLRQAAVRRGRDGVLSAIRHP